MKQSERDTQDTCEHRGNDGSDIITCSSCRGQPNEIANTALRELLNGQSGMTFLRIVIPLQLVWWSMIFFRKPVSTFRDHGILIGLGALLQARLYTGSCSTARRDTRLRSQAMRGVNMDQDEAKRKESRTVVWIVLAVGLVFLGLAFLIPYDSMVAQIIRGVIRGF